MEGKAILTAEPINGVKKELKTATRRPAFLIDAVELILDASGITIPPFDTLILKNKSRLQAVLCQLQFNLPFIGSLTHNTPNATLDLTDV